MRRFIIPLFVFFVIGACSTTEQLVMQPLYSVTSENIANIESDFVIDRLLLYKHSNIMLQCNEILTIERFTFDSGLPTTYAMAAHYQGNNWRFIDTICVRTDPGLFTLQDDQPTRLSTFRRLGHRDHRSCHSARSDQCAESHERAACAILSRADRDSGRRCPRLATLSRTVTHLMLQDLDT